MDVGAVLREARDRRGLSLDQVSHVTKIGVTILRNIEQNEIEKLRERVFLRGFLSAYAREVGLSPEATVQQYLGQFESTAGIVTTPERDASDASNAHTAGSTEEQKEQHRPLRVHWLLAAAMLIVVGSYLVARWRAPAPTNTTGVDSATPVAAAQSSPTRPTTAAAPRLETATTGSRDKYAQPSLASRYESGWENERLRVRRISVEPGAQAPAQREADRVFVFLTADLQGRIPPAEAIWQPAGAQELENRGRLRVEAVLIEVKNAPSSTVGVTPPEVLPTAGAVDVRLLIDNPRVFVTRQRYFPGAYAVGPRHFHPQDAVIVYLRGGYTWLPYLALGPYRVRRGDIDILPANTFHRFGNAGGDPLEFLVIFPK